MFVEGVLGSFVQVAATYLAEVVTPALVLLMATAIVSIVIIFFVVI